jgi:hypothetical protein
VPSVARNWSFRATRAYLTSWAPPQPISDSDHAQPAGTGTSTVALSPAWGLAAAAVLVMAAAADRERRDSEYDRRRAHPNGMAHDSRSGCNWRRCGTVSAAELERVAQRLNGVSAACGAAGRQAASNAASDRLSDAEILRQVRQWIAE